jgi:5-formyltetrahydrofolate cyclo-ligase
MTDKNELREHALWHMERIRPEDEDVEHAATLFQTHIPITKGQTVALYWPMAHEFDVRIIMDDLLKQGVQIALPIAHKTTREMTFSRWNGSDDLVKGDFGIFIPPVLDLVEPDIVVVPMLAFDLKGNRLGRGAGHYDTTLAALKQKRNILVVGVAFAAQAVLFNLPVETHDQKLDMILTPKGVHDFRN